MDIFIYRRWKKEKYSIGYLYINGFFVCSTLEDTDRGLKDFMSESEIKRRKIPHLTAIPSGSYEIDMETISPKFSKYPFYMEVCGGKLPRLKNVKGFDGVLIHVADGDKGADLLSGCIGVGFNTIKGGLSNGKEVFRELYNMLKDAHDKGEKIKLTIE